MMEPEETQAKLNAAYDTWKAEIIVRNSDVEGFSPPLLLSVTDDYCHAKTRIMFFGKETNDWSWNKNLRTDYPGYPLDWPFQDLNWFQDFLNSSEGVEGLAWAYKEFAFAQCQPRTRSKLFWQAFRDVQKWPDAGVMWNNLAKCDFYDGNKRGDRSILRANSEKQKLLYASQRELFKTEMVILDPHICLFMSGPSYDEIIKQCFPGVNILEIVDLPQRQFARLEHPSLPKASFRTYHPIYLNLSHNWGYIDRAKLNAFELL